MNRKTKKKENHGKAASPLQAAAGSSKPSRLGSREASGDGSIFSKNDRTLVLGICFFLAAVVWMVFGQTLGHEFVNYDDDINVYENADIKNGLSFRGIVWAFTHSLIGHWDPLTTLTHMLDCQLYGLNPWGHHLTNVLLHAATAILLFLVLRKMTAAPWRSAFVAVVFAIHPLRVESVAWISERKDVLSGVFFMLTIWAYVSYVRNARSLTRYLGVVFLFALGLMSKSMLVTLPFVLLLLDCWPLGRFADIRPAHAKTSKPKGPLSNGRFLILEKLPLFAMSALACVAQLVANREAIVPMGKLPLSFRVSNAFVSCAIYIWQMIYPRGLAVFYPLSNSSLPVWQVSMALILLVAISLISLVLLQKHPYFLVGWLWYLGMLVPVIGIVQSGGLARADRYTYLPQIGLYLMLAWMVADLSSKLRYRRTVLGGLSAMIITALIFCAHTQASYWNNSVVLWNHSLAFTEDNFVVHENLFTAHYNFGNALFEKGETDQAIVHFQKALKLKPDDEKSHDNIGTALLQKGLIDEAIAQHKKAIELNPNYEKSYNNLGNALLQKGLTDEAVTQFQKALQLKPDYAKAHSNLGNALLEKGRLDEAIIHYRKAVDINSGDEKFQFNLGMALTKKGRVDEAIPHLEKAVELKPNYAKAHCYLALAVLKKGKVEKALVHFQKALEIQPQNLLVQNSMAWVLATCPEASVRNGVRAVELAMQANQAAGEGDPGVLDTLAAAYAETGHFSEAVETARRALQLAITVKNSTLADSLRRELALYVKGTPFRDETLSSVR